MIPLMRVHHIIALDELRQRWPLCRALLDSPGETEESPASVGPEERENSFGHGSPLLLANRGTEACRRGSPSAERCPNGIDLRTL
jgi:hypothetical protein